MMLAGARAQPEEQSSADIADVGHNMYNEEDHIDRNKSKREHSGQN
jgi:hypothetical protein